MSQGIDPEIYLYLNEQPSKRAIGETLRRLDMKPADLLRPKEPIGEALGLYNGVSGAKILAAMAQHPHLIQRPIVITPKGAVLARPPLKVDEVL